MADHEDLLELGDIGLTEEDRRQAESALQDEDMELGEGDADGRDAAAGGAQDGHQPSPVIQTVKNGSYRFAMVFVTLYPGKFIHYGHLVPLHPDLVREFSPDFPEFCSDSDLFITPLNDSHFPSKFEPSDAFYRYISYLERNPGYRERCPTIRIHQDSCRILPAITNVYFPLLLDSRKRERQSRPPQDTPSSTASTPAKKTGDPAASAAAAAKDAAAASASSSPSRTNKSKVSVKTSASTNFPAPLRPPLRQPKLPSQGAASGDPGGANKRSTAVVSVPQPFTRTRVEIWESKYDRNTVSTPLYDVMEKAYRLKLEQMVDKKIADFRLAAEMDWMQRDAEAGCGVITARSSAQLQLIQDAVASLEVSHNGVVYQFRALLADRADRHKAYVRLFTLRAKAAPRDYVRGVLEKLPRFDPMLTSAHFSVGHPTLQNDYTRMTVFVSDRLRKFIERSHHTIPAIGGSLRVDFQDEVQARREAAAKAAGDKGKAGVAAAAVSGDKDGAPKPGGAEASAPATAADRDQPAVVPMEGINPLPPASASLPPPAAPPAAGAKAQNQQHQSQDSQTKPKKENFPKLPPANGPSGPGKRSAKK